MSRGSDSGYERSGVHVALGSRASFVLLTLMLRVAWGVARYHLRDGTICAKVQVMLSLQTNRSCCSM